LKLLNYPRWLVALGLASVLASCQWLSTGVAADSDAPNHETRTVATVTGMPPVVNPENLYSEMGTQP